MHDFEWAMGELRKGNTVSRAAWRKDMFIRAVRDVGRKAKHLEMVGKKKGINIPYSPTKRDIRSKDWVLNE